MNRLRPSALTLLAVAATGMLLAAGCKPADDEPSAALSVAVSIAPQAFFVKRVGGDRVKVQVLVQPGQSPATYSPTPRQLRELARARILFRTGVPFEEALLPRISANMPRLKVIDTRRGIEPRELAAHAHEHEHKAPDRPSGGAQGLGEQDPHVWLNPLLALQQAATIRDALIENDPAGRAEYEANYAALASELAELHRGIATKLAPYRGRAFFVFHPAYGYFAEAYGLKQVAVERGGKKPTPRELAQWVRMARARDVRVVFVQPQFDQSVANALAEAIGGAVVTLDPLARDYIQNMEAMAEKIANEFGRAKREGQKVKGER